MTGDCTPHTHRHTGIMVAAAVAGALLTVLLLSCTRPSSGPRNSAKGLHALEDDFVGLAEKTLPAVVGISCDIEQPATMPLPERLQEWFEEHGHDIPEGLFDDERGEHLWKWFEEQGHRLPKDFFDDERGEDADDETDEEAPPALRGASIGSGWIYDAEGFIVTNAHVVRDATRINVSLNDRPDDDRLYAAELWGTDPKSELAVIKIEADRRLPALKLGSSEKTKVGSWVMAVGRPFDLPRTVTVGVVSAKGRMLPGQSQYISIGDVIQTDAPINVGNSGGPLVNLDGEVVGINVAITSPGAALMPVSVGIGFAIPADTAAHVVPKLVAERKVPRGWLGIRIDDLTPNMRDFFKAPDGGALVTKPLPGTPAAEASLRVDDVIVAVGDQQVSSTWDLQKAISRSAPYAKVALRIIRDGKEKELTATLGEMPAKYAGLGDPKTVAAAKKKQLGLEVKAIDRELEKEFDLDRDRGVVVVKVKPNSLAMGKVRPGDVVVKVNEAEVRTVAQYEAAIKAARASERHYMLLRLERRISDDELTLITADIALEP